MGHFRVIGVGYIVQLQSHLVDKPKGGFWVEGKFEDNVSSLHHTRSYIKFSALEVLVARVLKDGLL